MPTCIIIGNSPDYHHSNHTLCMVVHLAHMDGTCIRSGQILYPDISFDHGRMIRGLRYVLIELGMASL